MLELSEWQKSLTSCVLSARVGRGERKGPHAKRGGGEVGGCATIDAWMEIDGLAGNDPMTHPS